MIEINYIYVNINDANIITSSIFVKITRGTLRDKNQLSLQVLKKFGIIYGSVRRHFREVERISGVTSQLWIMQVIAETSGIGVSELATRLSIHQSTCSRLVEKLVAGKPIIKHRGKEDQRRVGLCL